MRSYGWILLAGGLLAVGGSLMRIVLAGLLRQALLGVGIWVGLTTLYSVSLILATRSMLGRWSHDSRPRVLSLRSGATNTRLAVHRRAA